MSRDLVQEAIKPYREPGAGLQEAATRLLALYRGRRELESCSPLYSRLQHLIDSYGPDFDEYTLPPEAWLEMDIITELAEEAPNDHISWKDPLLDRYLNYYRGMPSVWRDNQKGFRGDPEKYKDAYYALQRKDYEQFARIISHVFPVRLCRRNHPLAHGLSPLVNSGSREKLSPREYVDRLESILDEGLRPSSDRVHNFSDKTIRAAYFARNRERMGMYPWGDLIVITYPDNLEQPVFMGRIYNPLRSDPYDTEHVVYSHERIKPRLGFTVDLRHKNRAYYRENARQEIESLLAQKHIPFNLQN